MNHGFQVMRKLGMSSTFVKMIRMLFYGATVSVNINNQAAKAEETRVDNLVGILHKFGEASELEINWHMGCVLVRPRTTAEMDWKIPMEVGRKWRYVKTMRHTIWSRTVIIGCRPISSKHDQRQTQVLDSTNLSLAWQTLVVNHVLIPSLLYFMAVRVGSKRVIGRIKALLQNHLWSRS